MGRGDSVNLKHDHQQRWSLVHPRRDATRGNDPVIGGFCCLEDGRWPLPAFAADTWGGGGISTTPASAAGRGGLEFASPVASSSPSLLVDVPSGCGIVVTSCDEEEASSSPRRAPQPPPARDVESNAAGGTPAIGIVVPEAWHQQRNSVGGGGGGKLLQTTDPRSWLLPMPPKRAVTLTAATGAFVGAGKTEMAAAAGAQAAAVAKCPPERCSAPPRLPTRQQDAIPLVRLSEAGGRGPGAGAAFLRVRRAFSGPVYS